MAKKTNKVGDRMSDVGCRRSEDGRQRTEDGRLFTGTLMHASHLTPHEEQRTKNGYRTSEVGGIRETCGALLRTFIKVVVGQNAQEP